MTVKESLLSALREERAETAEDFALLSLREGAERPEDCYLVTADGFGGERGKEVLREFFTVMANLRRCPAYLILMDTAVTLLKKDSPLLPVFAEMEQNGAAVMASVASAALYVKEGEIDPVFLAETGQILETLRRAKKVITL